MSREGGDGGLTYLISESWGSAVEEVDIKGKLCPEGEVNIRVREDSHK